MKNHLTNNLTHSTLFLPPLPSLRMRQHGASIRIGKPTPLRTWLWGRMKTWVRKTYYCSFAFGEAIYSHAENAAVVAGASRHEQHCSPFYKSVWSVLFNPHLHLTERASRVRQRVSVGKCRTQRFMDTAVCNSLPIMSLPTGKLPRRLEPERRMVIALVSPVHGINGSPIKVYQVVKINIHECFQPPTYR